MLLFLPLLAAASPAKPVWLLSIEGAISPASADFFVRTLQRAEAEGVELLVLQLDTPGGLDASMRQMVKAILASEVPVATYVAPAGARAASAGTYLAYASHIAAMAPATNLGASTPVSVSPMGGAPGAEGYGPSAMEKKVINDAVAYLQGLAELRGRNAEWAEETVREGASLSAREALELGVIDLVAEEIETLLAALHGREVTLDGAHRTLQLDDYQLTRIEPGWRYELLNLITDPNVAYILLMIGLYGLILEFYNPGVGIAGVVGVICLLLAAFALHLLPINYAGLALILVGVGLMVAEALSPSFGVLGVGGVAAFVTGSVLLLDSDLPGYQISLPLIAAFAVSSAAIFIFVVGAALNARRHRVVTGLEALIGAPAEALEDFDGEGRVLAQGEHWHAVADRPIQRGQPLRITALDGLTVHVEPTEERIP